MQGCAEAVGQLRCGEPAGDITIGFEIGAEVTAGGVPGCVGIALHDPVGLFSAHAGAHKGEQHFHMDIEDGGDWFRERSDTGVRIDEALIDALALLVGPENLSFTRM